MTTFSLILLVCLGTLVIGWGILSLFVSIRVNLPLLLSLSWLIGWAGIALELTWYSWLHIPWNIPYLAIPWVIVLGYLFYQKKYIKIEGSLFSPLTVFALLSLIIPTILFFKWVDLPVNNWDAWLMWNFKAKVFFYVKSIPLDFLTKTSLNIDGHMDYPLLIPLAQTWIFQWIGGISSQAAHMLFFFFYDFLILGFIGILHTAYKKTFTIILMAILLSATPAILTYTFFIDADLPLGFALMLGMGGIYLWHRKKEVDYLKIGLLCLGAAGLIKNEGMMLWIVVSVILTSTIIFSKKIPHLQKVTFYKYLSVSLLMWLPWRIFSTIHHLQAEQWKLPVTTQIAYNRILIILGAAYNELILSPHWGIIWILFFAALIVSLIFRLSSRWLTVCTFIFLLIYLLVYVATPSEINSHLRTSLDRLVLQLTPLATLAFCLTLFSLSDTAKDLKNTEKL